MTKKELQLYTELKQQLDSLLRQYTLFLETREVMVAELRSLRDENDKLRKANKLNNLCWYYSSGPRLPFGGWGK